MKKQFIAILLVVLLAGCGGGTDAPKNGESATVKPTESDVPVAVQTFSVLSLGGIDNDTENMDDPVGKVITEKTGVRLEFEVPIGDYNQKLSLIIASEDFPDMIVNKENAMNTLVDAKALIPLNDLIDQYGPNIKKFLGDKIERLSFSKDDPNYYGFGDAKLIDQDVPGYYWGVAFAMQNAIVKEAGFPDVKTLEDYEKLIYDYMQANPTIDGQPTIGISLIASDGWRHLISITNPAFLAAGFPDDGEFNLNLETETVKLHHTIPEEKEYFRWLNHINDIGLLDPESFTQSYDSYLAKISSGRVLGLIDALWEYNDAQQSLNQSGKEERTYMPYPILMDPDNTVWKQYQSGVGVTAGGLMVTKNCKNPEKLVGFMDYLVTEEAMILKTWGIEGQGYNMVGDQRVRGQEMAELFASDVKAFRELTGAEKYTMSYFHQPGYGWKTSNGQMLSAFDPETVKSVYTKTEKEMLAGYGVDFYTDLFTKPSDFPQVTHGGVSVGKTEETKVIWQKVRDLTLKSVAKAVLAKPDDFDAAWQEFLDSLDAVGLATLEQEATESFREGIERWK